MYKKGKTNIRSGQKTQKGGLLPLLLRLTPLALNLLGNMSGKGINLPPYHSRLSPPRRRYQKKKPKSLTVRFPYLRAISL